MANLGVIATSINYLDSNDIAENDLNINTSAQNSASTIEALGISNFIENLPGGAEFKQNSKAITSNYVTNAKTQVAKQKTTNTGTGAGGAAETVQNVNKTGYNNTGLDNRDTRRTR